MSTILEPVPARRGTTATRAPSAGQTTSWRPISTIARPFRFLAQIILVLYVIEFLVLTSLLPLSVVLLVIPAAIPDESVIADTVSRVGWLRNLLRRQWNLAIGMAAFVALVVFATEVVVRLGIAQGSLAWGWAVVIVYCLDLAILLAIGRVPLAYNIRSLRLRWPISALTSAAFTAVVTVLTVLLAFVNGMVVLTAESGQPGNVLILADGSTDEVFSNLGYSDVALIERETATVDDDGNTLPQPMRVKRIVKDGREQPMASRETYCIVNRPVDNEPERRQFVQVRGIIDPEMASMVHDLPLLSGRWFSEAGVQTPKGAQPGERDQIEAVLGGGVARELGKKLGDSFAMGDREWVVVGLVKSDGTSFGSEVWGKQAIVAKLFNKNGYTSLVARVEDDGGREATATRARLFSAHLTKRFSNPKVSAQPETEYFAKLSENNKLFLWVALAVASVMSLGGIFGVMNTMFAAVAQRIKDIGVLRILGFKRWQILVSFMLESLVIALIGGILGMAAGSLFHGMTATSVISSGQGGGGKTVILRLIVDAQVILAGVLFTLVMGRLGGLIPALSATRQSILDTLR